MPTLAGISIYPIKSLESVAVPQARIAPGGALEGDRAFAFFDADGKFINGKRNARIHQLRSFYDAFTGTLRLGTADDGLRVSFHITRQRPQLQTWLSEFFGISVEVRDNTQVGFPDDLDCPGPTLIGAATLSEVASWFPPLSAGQIRLRMRANLEIAQAPAFWEDHLYTTKGSLVRFRIGDVLFDGNNPCQRCVVPPRDPFTGEGYADFSNTFMKRRKETLPPWAEASRFNHFYRLAVNTIVPASEAGKTLRIGDEVEILAAAV
ncbi:MAG: MOSC N-terminal beta barrel domain-containing protein [Planctomycetota bacterium]|nr:MOSC N-terminal beta barrel domain-containing protein [Planctomycetota bacterium]